MFMLFKEHKHGEVSVVKCSLFLDDFTNQQNSTSVSADGGDSAFLTGRKEKDKD